MLRTPRFRVKSVEKVLHSFVFLKLERHYIKVLKCIHLNLWREIFPHSCGSNSSLLFEKISRFFLRLISSFFLKKQGHSLHKE